MHNHACSNIGNITSQKGEVAAREDSPFAFWGPTPMEARKAAVAKKKGFTTSAPP